MFHSLRGWFARKSPRVRLLFIIFLLIFLLVISAVAWFGTSIFQATGKIITTNQNGVSVLFHKNSADVKPTELQGEGDGRINILLIGIDQAAGLADVQQVLSIDTINHKAAMLSVPRDLWATIPKYGQNKINACHSLAERVKKGTGADLCLTTVSGLLDLPVHYYIQVNFSGLKELVDAVGGVTVDVENSFDDSQYPDEHEGYVPPLHFKAGIQTMNGTTALQFARSRHSNTAAEGSDFARSRRQQKILLAIKEKALSAGVLANPVRLNQIIQAVGNNLQTNLQTGEIQQLVTLFKDIDTTQIITKVLDTAPDSPLTGGDQGDGRGYIITPRDGDYTYKSLALIAHQIFTDPYLAKEKSSIEIRNATAKTGLGATVSSLLKSYGYNVVKVSNSVKKENFTELVDYSNGRRPFTESFLEKRFNLKARKSVPSADVTTDFVITLGADYDASVTSIKSHGL